MNRPIIARNITNLTDARYFAAWDVDYMSFNGNNNSPFKLTEDKIIEIKNWVEGPKYLIESDALELNEWADGHIISHIFSSLPINKICIYVVTPQDFVKGLPDGNYIITDWNVDNYNTIIKPAINNAPNFNLYFDMKGHDIKIIKELDHHGIVLQGGEEEKVGFKSFDELDVWYEYLLDEEI